MWKVYLGWTLMVLFALGSAEQHPEVSAMIFVAGVLIYWFKRIEKAIKEK